MRTRTYSMAALVSSILVAVALVPSAQARTSAEMEQLQKDLAAIKGAQEAMRKDMEEIKKLLQARPAPAVPPTPALDAVLQIGKSPVLGSDAATVTLIEFTDFQCPYCKRYAQNTFPEIKKEYIDTGKVRYVARDLPLSIHAKAPKAAEAAHCAGEQGKYWQMHDAIFARQNELNPEQLAQRAGEIGLDASAFKTCMDNSKYKELVDAGVAEAAKLGITGTPTVLIGRSDGDKVRDIKVLRGAQPFATFKTRIDELLAEPAAAKPAGSAK